MSICKNRITITANSLVDLIEFKRDCQVINGDVIKYSISNIKGTALETSDMKIVNISSKSLLFLAEYDTCNIPNEEDLKMISNKYDLSIITMYFNMEDSYAGYAAISKGEVIEELCISKEYSECDFYNLVIESGFMDINEILELSDFQDNEQREKLARKYEVKCDFEKSEDIGIILDLSNYFDE